MVTDYMHNGHSIGKRMVANGPLGWWICTAPGGAITHFGVITDQQELVTGQAVLLTFANRNGWINKLASQDIILDENDELVEQ